MKKSELEKRRQTVGKLKPFPQMYVSDNPYYLEKNLVVIGLVCDAEKRIDIILYQLESIACLFNSTTFILFESNSKDNTLLRLQRWSLRKPLNCKEIAFKPENKKLYHDLKTLQDLIDFFEGKQDNDDIDGVIVKYLSKNYKNIEQVDLYEISQYLTSKLRITYEMTEIQIEEILYEKLMPIKYVKYHKDIEEHRNKVFKSVLNGDEMVQKELAIETEIVKQLKIYGGLNELHTGYNVIDELEKERLREQKLKQLMSQDGVEGIFDENKELLSIFMAGKSGTNELDKEYNFLQGIKREEMKRHSHSNFEDEFGDIHREIDQQIQYEEEIVHEKLKERRRRYEERRRQEKAKRLSKLKENQKWMDTTKANKARDADDEIALNGIYEEHEIERFRRSGEEKLQVMQEQEQEKDEEVEFRKDLYRIERFVIYRNMLLNKTMNLSEEMGINFDYVLVIDMDIYSIDIRTFMNELYFMPHNIDGLCIDGIDWMGYTRDTFATVKINGGWVHYGHDTLVNNTKYIYDNKHAMEQRTKIPDHENNRFEEVKSCFGGVMVYRNFENNLFDQQCRYTLTRDIFYTQYNNTDEKAKTKKAGVDMDSDEELIDDEKMRNVSFDGSVFDFNYTFDYWLNNRYHNEYSEQSKLEMKLFVKQYVELLQVFDKTVENRELIPRDGDICEHIPFHYCLWDKGFKFAISSRAKLYYDKFYPMDRYDTNWDYYLSNRAKFTQ